MHPCAPRWLGLVLCVSGCTDPSSDPEDSGGSTSSDPTTSPASTADTADTASTGLDSTASADGPSTSDTDDTGTPPDGCDPGTSETAWARSCPAEPRACVEGSWSARPQGSDGHPLRHESEHFAIYYFTGDPDGGGPLLGLSQPLSPAQADAVLATLESIWDHIMGDPMNFPEPYCDQADKPKATVHLDDYYPLWGGGWNCSGTTCMGLWVGSGATMDPWGLAHEFTHGLQSTTAGFPDCGGVGCWIYESHANWVAHQIAPDNPHCSEMLVNAPHLYYGHTRNRYCNWQFFEFLKDTECYSAVHDMWTWDAPPGEGDPWQKLMGSRGWDLDELNDRFGEWAMHNVTWDYRNPPPTDGEDQGAVYRESYGPIEDTNGAPQRRLRLARLEPLDDEWADNRRFVTPYHQAPQRWGYNVTRLHVEPGAEEVRVTFRGVVQPEADSDWRWGLVATDAGLTTSRYSELQRGSDGEAALCLEPGDDNVYLVVMATPSTYQKIVWEGTSDGTPYPSIYRYPYMVELDGAWPAGFADGAPEACPEGTQPHENGGGCVVPGVPASVYVGPYARVMGGTVSGDARIEDHATIFGGATINGGTVGALSTITDFSVADDAIVRSVFYPLGWFGNNQSATGTAYLLGDLEFVAQTKSDNAYYGFVSNDWGGVSSISEVTVAPPYAWRP